MITKLLAYMLAWLHWLLPGAAWKAAEIEMAWYGIDEEEFFDELLEESCEDEWDATIESEELTPCEQLGEFDFEGDTSKDPDCYLCSDTDCLYHPRFSDQGETGTGEGG